MSPGEETRGSTIYNNALEPYLTRTTTMTRDTSLSSAQARDELLDRLVTGASRRAYRIANDLLRDQAEAEDAVQDALTKACESYRSLRDPTSVVAEAWFLRIVTVACLRRLRRRRLVQVLLGSKKIPEPKLATSETGETQLSDSQQTSRVVSLVQNLATMQRTTLILRYGHDLSLPEIAKLTDTKVSTVKTHLGRGLARLRQTLNPDTNP